MSGSGRRFGLIVSDCVSLGLPLRSQCIILAAAEGAQHQLLTGLAHTATHSKQRRLSVEPCPSPARDVGGQI